jgi:hypothetical protein
MISLPAAILPCLSLTGLRMFIGGTGPASLRRHRSAVEIGRLKTGQLLSDGRELFLRKDARLTRSHRSDVKDAPAARNGGDRARLCHGRVYSYHFGKHDRYTLFARKSGARKTLFSETEAKNYMFQDGRRRCCRLCARRWGRRRAAGRGRLSAGRKRARLRFYPRPCGDFDGKAFFTRPGEPVERTYDGTASFGPSGLDGEGLRQVTCRPSRMTRSGRSLQPGLNWSSRRGKCAEPPGEIVRFDPSDGSFACCRNGSAWSTAVRHGTTTAI